MNRAELDTMIAELAILRDAIAVPPVADVVRSL